MTDSRNLDLEIYKVISRQSGGMNAAAIAGILRRDAYDVRRSLSASPLINELCYRNSRGQYSSLISGRYPHYGLDHFSCCYFTVETFLELPEKVFLEKLEQGKNEKMASSSFSAFNRKNARMARCSMLGMFTDLRMREEKKEERQQENRAGGVDVSERMKKWEIAFYPEIIVSGGVLRCSCDVLLITECYAFAFSFLSASRSSDRQLLKLYTLSGDFGTIFGSEYRIVAAPVLTNGSGQIVRKKVTGEKQDVSVELTLCSRDMMYSFLDLQLDAQGK